MMSSKSFENVFPWPFNNKQGREKIESAESSWRVPSVVYMMQVNTVNWLNPLNKKLQTSGVTYDTVKALVNVIIAGLKRELMQT
jgi:hypothetical protein